MTKIYIYTFMYIIVTNKNVFWNVYAFDHCRYSGEQPTIF